MLNCSTPSIFNGNQAKSNRTEQKFHSVSFLLTWSGYATLLACAKSALSQCALIGAWDRASIVHPVRLVAVAGRASSAFHESLARTFPLSAPLIALTPQTEITRRWRGHAVRCMHGWLNVHFGPLASLITHDHMRVWCVDAQIVAGDCVMDIQDY